MQNLQRILVPIDFSDCSINALIYAINLSENLNIEIQVLYALKENDDKTVEDINKQFDRLEHHYFFNRRSRYKFILKQGETKAVINQVVRESKIDIVILGMIGAGGMQEQLTGSLTAALIDRPPCALMAIPENCHVLTSKNIAVANDNKSVPNPPELYVLNFISEAFDARVDIFHVAQEEVIPLEDGLSIKESFEELFKYNLHSYTEVKGDNLLHAIKKYTYENKIDLLTVLHRLKTVTDQSRSVSKQLAFAIKLPLLIIPIK